MVYYCSNISDECLLVMELTDLSERNMLAKNCLKGKFSEIAE